MIMQTDSITSSNTGFTANYKQGNGIMFFNMSSHRVSNLTHDTPMSVRPSPEVAGTSQEIVLCGGH